jgi:hypothetical protein
MASLIGASQIQLISRASLDCKMLAWFHGVDVRLLPPRRTSPPHVIPRPRGPLLGHCHHLDPSRDTPRVSSTASQKDPLAS